MLKKPRFPNHQYIHRAVDNLKGLTGELPVYWESTQFTNVDNMVQEYPERFYETWSGKLGAAVGSLFDVKLIWREKVITQTIEVGKTFLFVGDKKDVNLAIYFLDYLVKSIEVSQEALVMKYKVEAKVQRRLKRKGKPYIDYTHSKEYASKILNINVLLLIKELQYLLDLKPNSEKEKVVNLYMLWQVKLDFAENPGPKSINLLYDKVNFNKATTSPNVFKLNKIIS